MITLSKIFVAAIALLHIYILIIEMFLWDKPKGIKAFNLTPELANSTKTMAANQGFYNGFLAAGLLWGLYLGELKIQVFFLLCVLAAGVFGAITASKRILFVQALPAAIALALLWVS